MNILLLTDANEGFDIMTFLQGESFLTALKSLALAILVWIVGSMIISRLTKFITTAFEKSNMDESLRPFLSSLVSVMMKVLLLLAVASTLGMQVTSFVAILSAATFAVGMALQGSLSNFAGGIIILVFKPFKVGDRIEAQGFGGVVKEIQIFNTLLETLDNQIIIIPNGVLSNGSIQNHSMSDLRGVELVFGIGYGDDIDRAKEVIWEVIKRCPHTEAYDKTTVVISELAGSSVNIAVRPWTKSEHWHAVYFYMQENVKKEFDKNDIGIPYNTIDVNLLKDS